MSEPQNPTPTLVEQWKQFEAAVVSPDAGAVQRDEMQGAFYAGAWSMLCTIRQIGEPEMSEAEGVAWLESLNAEARRFAADKAKRAGSQTRPKRR